MSRTKTKAQEVHDEPIEAQVPATTTETRLGLGDEKGSDPAKKGLRDFPKFGTNPFIKSLAEYKVSKKRTVVKGNKAIVDNDTGLTEDVAEITTTRSVDGDLFVKLYSLKLREIFSLKPGSFRVLEVLLHQVQTTAKDSDLVALNYRITAAYFETHDLKPMSRSTFHTAIVEMVAKGFLAQSEHSSDLYFINPNLFFNGNRISFVEEWHIQKQDRLFNDAQTVERRKLGKETKDQ